MKAEKKRRLSASAAVLVLAREMWMRDHPAPDYSVWDEDELLTTTYETYMAKAEQAIREEMARG